MEENFYIRNSFLISRKKRITLRKYNNNAIIKLMEIQTKEEKSK